MSQSMTGGAVKFLQTYLAGENPYNRQYYEGEIDGLRGPKTHRAAKAALKDRAVEIQAADRETWFQTWSDKRISVATFQIAANDKYRSNPEQYTSAGTVDGWWGPQTDAAYLSVTGRMSPSFNTAAGNVPPFQNLSKVNPNNWPDDNTSSLIGFYGSPCEMNTSRVEAYTKFKLAWNNSQTTSSTVIHSKCADSLERVYEKIDAAYSQREMTELGLDQYGGSYNCRKVRGGSNWSTHAFGIAIDIHPAKNRLNWDHTRATLAHEDLAPYWQAWYDEGWRGLGPEKNYDWMHVQAALI